MLPLSTFCSFAAFPRRQSVYQTGWSRFMGSRLRLSRRWGYSRSFHFALNSYSFSLYLHLLTNPRTNLLILTTKTPNESRLRGRSPWRTGPTGGWCTACYFDNKQSHLCLLYKCSFYVSIAFCILLITSQNEIGHAQLSNARVDLFPMDDLISSKSLSFCVFKISHELTNRKHAALPGEEMKENSMCWARTNYTFLMHLPISVSMKVSRFSVHLLWVQNIFRPLLLISILYCNSLV